MVTWRGASHDCAGRRLACRLDLTGCGRLALLLRFCDAKSALCEDKMGGGIDKVYTWCAFDKDGDTLLHGLLMVWSLYASRRGGRGVRSQDCLVTSHFITHLIPMKKFFLLAFMAFALSACTDGLLTDGPDSSGQAVTADDKTPGGGGGPG